MQIALATPSGRAAHEERKARAARFAAAAARQSDTQETPKADVTDRELAVPFVADPGIIPLARKYPSAAMIRHIVERYYGMEKNGTLLPTRRREYVRPRHVAFYLITDIAKMSLPATGRVFGMDHTTILNGVRNISSGLLSDADLAHDVALLEGTIAATHQALNEGCEKPDVPTCSVPRKKQRRVFLKPAVRKRRLFPRMSVPA